MSKSTFLLVFISYCVGLCNACPNRELIDSLFSQRYEEKFRENEVIPILSLLINEKCVKNDSAIAEFAISNSLYGYLGIGVLARNHSSVLPELLLKHSKELSRIHWSYFATNLSVSQCWGNPVIDNIIENQVYQNPDVVTRDMILQYFANCATVAICKRIAEMYSEEPERIVRNRHLILYCRFNSPNLNKVIQKELKINPYSFEKIIRIGFKQYNRYDFLPELYILQDKLVKEENPLRKTEIEEILTTLKDVIPYLEKKKAENAPIGLPLDWGIEKKDGKVKISNK
jgi:hypothetical protein